MSFPNSSLKNKPIILGKNPTLTRQATLNTNLSTPTQMIFAGNPFHQHPLQGRLHLTIPPAMPRPLHLTIPPAIPHLLQSTIAPAIPHLLQSSPPLPHRIDAPPVMECPPLPVFPSPTFPIPPPLLSPGLHQLKMILTLPCPNLMIL